MIQRQINIINRLGLHARAAAKLVGVATAYKSQITIGKDGKEVNGKSIMGVMMLAAGQHSQIEISVDGVDEIELADALEELIMNRFGEDQ